MPDLSTWLRAIVKDPAALGPLADWLEERGNPVGELVRLSITKRPAYRPRKTAPGKFGWFWDKRLLSWTPDGPSILPVEVHAHLPGSGWSPFRRRATAISLGTKVYSSEREAWAALAVAVVELLASKCKECRGYGVQQIWVDAGDRAKQANEPCPACDAFGFIVQEAK